MNPLRRLLPATVAIELFTHRLYGPLVPVSPSVPDAGTRRAATAIEGVLGAATLIFSLLFFLYFLPAESSAGKIGPKSDCNSPRFARLNVSCRSGDSLVSHP